MPVTTTLPVREVYLAHHGHAVDLGYRHLPLIARQLVYAAHCATLTFLFLARKRLPGNDFSNLPANYFSNPLMEAVYTRIGQVQAVP